ncbi:MAG: DNA-methyltransferase [Phycisphaerae bacterium]
MCLPQEVRPGILRPGTPDFVVLAVCNIDVSEVLAGVRDMPPATTAHGKNGRNSAVEPANLFAAQKRNIDVCPAFARDHECTVFHGDCMELLATIPSNSAQLVVTSPPYNTGKDYENATNLDRYLRALAPTVDELVRVLGSQGSLCWQVGNYVKDSEVFPLDISYCPFFRKHGPKLRNRIVWHFAHGLHATKRFSGRYEVLLWFTKGDSYTCNLDDVRVPSKYDRRWHVAEVAGHGARKLRDGTKSS